MNVCRWGCEALATWLSKDTAHLRHRARRGASLCGSRGYEGEEDEGAASIETIASYGTRFAVCDLRACYLLGGTPFALRLNALR